MKSALDVEIGPRLRTGPRSESYIFVPSFVVLKLQNGHDFHSKTYKGVYFVKILVELWFLISADRLIMLKCCTKFRQKKSQRVSDILSGHDFDNKIYKGA